MLTAIVAAVLAAPAIAQVPMEGSFTAERSCPALASIKKRSNPGDVALTPGAAYRLLARNRDEPTHYWIEVEGARPARRWVETGCGSIGEAAAGEREAREVRRRENSASGMSYVLALSWQPAFCETRPNTRECRSQTPGRRDASHFSLHGLWPQPRSNVFCKVDPEQKSASEQGRWEELPPVRLSPGTRARLEEVMPGVESHLDRHQWIKHGTCHPGGSAEAYYRDSLRLIEEINDSSLRAFFAERIGGTVATRDIRAAFDRAFGRGAGERLRVACKSDGGRRLIVEITIGLKGDIAGAPLAELIRASNPTDPGCPEGSIDRAGLQ